LERARVKTGTLKIGQSIVSSTYDLLETTILSNYYLIALFLTKELEGESI
jgi:hypothetical protein